MARSNRPVGSVAVLELPLARSHSENGGYDYKFQLNRLDLVRTHLQDRAFVGPKSGDFQGQSVMSQRSIPSLNLAVTGFRKGWDSSPKGPNPDLRMLAPSETNLERKKSTQPV